MLHHSRFILEMLKASFLKPTCWQSMLLGVMLLFSFAAYAQPSQTASGEEKSHPTLSEEAQVVVFNRHVAVFRSSLYGVPAATRAQRTQNAIMELLRDGGEGVVTVQREAHGNLLLIDGVLALILTSRDVDLFRGETLEGATQSTVKALQGAIMATQERRDGKRMLISISFAVAATLIALHLSWLIIRIRHLLVDKIALLLKSKTEKLRVAGESFLQFGQLSGMAKRTVLLFTTVLLLLIGYWWLSYVLNRFPYTRPWGEQLQTFLINLFWQIGYGILGAIPDLLVAIIIFMIARAMIRLIGLYFERVTSVNNDDGWLNADTAVPTRQILNMVVWLFAIVMAYPYVPGSSSEAFKGMSVLIGLMMTVGGSNLLSQVASGMIIVYSRALRIGEFVRINEHEGTVTELGTYATKIVTGTGVVIVLPNAFVLSTVTKNFSRSVPGSGYILETTVTIGYDAPWRQVEAMLVEAANRTKGVLETPAPRVFQTALTDFYPEYCLVCQARPEKPGPRAELLAALNANIQDVFNENGVQIMSPHYEADPVSLKVVPKTNWFNSPANPREANERK